MIAAAAPPPAPPSPSDYVWYRRFYKKGAEAKRGWPPNLAIVGPSYSGRLNVKECSHEKAGTAADKAEEEGAKNQQARRPQ